MPIQDIAPIVKVERMLEALLKGSNHIHWIGGYVYGRTSNDEPFVILYPADPRLQEKAVRVYPHDFKKLPDFISTDNIEGETDANPNKEKAMKRGIYNVCPLFQIVTYDGKDTQMGPEKRFGHVLAITNKMPEAATAVFSNGTAAFPPAAPPPPDAPPDDARGELSPQAMAERKPAKPQTKEWEFYEAVYQANKAIYPDATGVHKVAKLINSTWIFSKDEKINNAMSNALGSYARKRADLQSDKRDARTCHTQALAHAITHFDKFLAAAVQ